MLFFGIREEDCVQVVSSNEEKLKRLMGKMGYIEVSDTDASFSCTYHRIDGGELLTFHAPKYSILFRVNGMLYHMDCKTFNTLIKNHGRNLHTEK